MTALNHSTTNNAGPSPAPREARQRAVVARQEQVREVVRFCALGAYSKPFVLFNVLGGQFGKI